MIRKKIVALSLLFAAVASTGCYHAVITTGVQAAPLPVTHTLVIQLDWRIRFRSKPVDATQLCGGSPASKVETQHRS